MTTCTRLGVVRKPCLAGKSPEWEGRLSRREFHKVKRREWGSLRGTSTAKEKRLARPAWEPEWQRQTAAGKVLEFVLDGRSRLGLPAVRTGYQCR
jgi:hypothetical protein